MWCLRTGARRPRRPARRRPRGPGYAGPRPGGCPGSRSCPGGRNSRAGRSCRGNRNCRADHSCHAGRSLALLAVAALGFAEIHVVGNYLGARALVAFLVRPVPHLEPAAHNGHAALLKVLRYELSGRAPGDAVDEIGLLLFAAAKVAVHCDAEGRNGQLALGVSQLRVAGQAAMMTM